MATFRCPDSGSAADIKGCGLIFDVSAAVLASCDDLLDCPHCGCCFDPTRATNQPQPPGAAEAFSRHLDSYEADAGSRQPVCSFCRNSLDEHGYCAEPGCPRQGKTPAPSAELVDPGITLTFGEAQPASLLHPLEGWCVNLNGEAVQIRSVRSDAIDYQVWDDELGAGVGPVREMPIDDARTIHVH